MNNVTKEWAIKYIKDRRQEQIEDNQAPYAMGVDYHMFRKQVAKYIKKNSTQIRGDVFVRLNSEASKFYKDLLATGIQRSTIKQWLAKYEGITRYLWHD